MRTAAVILLCLTLAAFASVRTAGSTGHNTPGTARGSYTVTNIFAGGLSATYGIAVQDNVANSIWLLNWSDMKDYEYDSSTGSATGNDWDITGGVDPDDQAYCEYTSGNQWFMTDYAASFFAVFEEDGTWLRNVDGPAGYTNLFGIGVGHDMVYVGSPNETTLAWGSYTGTETTVTWTGEMAYTSVYGLAVYGDYLFVLCGVGGEDNVFIHSIAPDGTPSATPEWSCEFMEEAEGNGGIDYDGTSLWVYPQNTFLYQLAIDWTPGALSQSTWGGIKAEF